MFNVNDYDDLNQMNLRQELHKHNPMTNGSSRNQTNKFTSNSFDKGKAGRDNSKGKMQTTS